MAPPLEESDDDDVVGLSASTLAALKEFAIDRGIAKEESVDIQKVVQEAIASRETREEEFIYTFGNNNNPDDEKIEIRLQGLRRDIGQTLQSTGLTLWRAADTLANSLYENRSIFKGKSVLELGAGLGLCGILLSNFSPSRVSITDGDDDTITALKANCKLNDVSTGITCDKLLWSCDKKLMEEEVETFDYVIGSDIVYDSEHVTSLFHTAARHLANESAVFMLAYTKRNVSIDYVLQEARSSGLKVVLSPDDDEQEGIYHFKKRF